MLVQRLTKRLANLLSRLATRLRAALTSLAPGERKLGAEASPRDGRMNTQQSGSWLDDAHRLRPRRTALATADPNRRKHAAPADPRPAPRSGTPTRPIVPPTPPTQDPTYARPWVFPAHAASTPAPQQPAAASGALGGDEAQARRRLMSLKYLVRIGLYNEGFAPTDVPEQYQRSLGVDGEEYGEPPG
ncbi:MAG TPA: hypothetical protein VF116_07805 [Ktedonobacterales bacterium]